MEKEQLMLLGARAESYIKAHLREKIDRDALCRALSTNRTTLAKAIRLRTGMTLQRYILGVRIGKARCLLLSDEQNVEKIAGECGFSSAAYFSRVYKEQFGMTPAAFAARAREQDGPVRVYALDGDALPVLPWLHDCEISLIEADREYLSVFFDDSISLLGSVSRVRPGATKVTVRYHLSDPVFFVYRQFRRGKYPEKDFEVGYVMYNDAAEFIGESASSELYYGFHCVEYKHVILKLWSRKEPCDFMLDLNADRVEYEWGFDAPSDGIVDRMKAAGVRFSSGMTEKELAAAERFFGFTFPAEIAAFLRGAVPTGDRFFDFRDLSAHNLEKYQRFAREVESGFAYDLSNDPEFLRAMKRRYGTSGVRDTLEEILKEYENSPKLIPFYGNRCFFDGVDGAPIISYSQPCDSILYGADFGDWLKREFSREKRAFQKELPAALEKTGIWAFCIRTQPLIDAHDHCADNKKELENSKKCGCFHCLAVFSPEKIDRWIDSRRNTALCPFCGVYAVIGDASGYPVTKQFLKAMRDYWFAPTGNDR